MLMAVRRSLLPHLWLRTIAELNFGRLRDFGIDTLIVDKDDTLCTLGAQTLHPSLPPSAILAAVEAFGPRIFTLSNAADSFELDFGPATAEVRRKGAFRRIRTSRRKPFNVAELQMWFKEEQGSFQDFARVAVVGDRLLTDVALARRVGALTVLVRPFADSAPPASVRLLRRAEAALLGAFRDSAVLLLSHAGRELPPTLAGGCRDSL